MIFLPFSHATQYHSHDWFEPAIIFQCPICNQDFFKRRKERMVIAQAIDRVSCQGLDLRTIVGVEQGHTKNS